MLLRLESRGYYVVDIVLWMMFGMCVNMGIVWQETQSLECEPYLIENSIFYKRLRAQMLCSVRVCLQR